MLRPVWGRFGLSPDPGERLLTRVKQSPLRIGRPSGSGRFLSIALQHNRTVQQVR